MELPVNPAEFRGGREFDWELSTSLEVLGVALGWAL